MTGKWDLEKGHFAHVFMRISRRAAARLTDQLGIVHSLPVFHRTRSSGSRSGAVAAAASASAAAERQLQMQQQQQLQRRASGAAEAAAAVAAAAAAAAVMVVGTQQSTKQHGGGGSSGDGGWRRQQHRSSTSSGCLGFASVTRAATQTALVFKWRQWHRALLWAGMAQRHIGAAASSAAYLCAAHRSAT